MQPKKSAVKQKKEKRYARLRKAIRAEGYGQEALAKQLGFSTAYLNLRLCGRKHWKADEMYGILDILCVPYDQLHLYFPPEGMEKAE